MMAVQFGVIVMILCFLAGAYAIVDYCSVNNFNSNSTYMQFTKEVSTSEYTKKGRFKGLHCCSKGYRSIEWYKDGRAYPWPGDVSTFILYPESANQTIYAQTAASSDTGNYTCVVSNDTYSHYRHIDLWVIDKLPDSPKVTFNPVDQSVELGKSARLFCEAFVGLVDLPDAQNDISWRRSNSNRSIANKDHVQIEQVSREENQIIGAYLTIENVHEEDLGQYICRVNNPDTFIELSTWLRESELPNDQNGNSIPWKKIIFISIAIILLGIKLFLLNLQYGMSLRVKWKDRFSPLEQNDGKEQDVLVCFNEADDDLVRGALVSTLNSTYKYSYKCQHFPMVISSWAAQLEINVQKSRRILAVISPACFADKWDTTNLSNSFEQLLSLNCPITCILLKPFPKLEMQLKNSNGQTITTMLQKIHVVQWLSATDNHFWLSVRLRLPPKRNGEGTAPTNVSNITESATTRLNFDSHESLEILV